MRLLIVDDEEQILRLVKTILEGSGHEVTTANSAAQALAAIRESEGFDLLISDVTMPGMNGMELYETLRKDNHPLHKRFVFITGWMPSSRMRELVEATGCPVLFKPFSKQSLESIVEQFNSGES